MSLAQQLARAHRERLARMTPVRVRPVVTLLKFTPPPSTSILAPNRHDAWPNKSAPLPPHLAPSAPAPEGPRFPRIKEIQLAVCARYRVELIDMISVRRTQDLVRPRQVAMYLCRKLTTHGYPDIGRRFGNRDHTTAMWGVRRIEQRLSHDARLAADIAALTAQLGGGC